MIYYMVIPADEVSTETEIEFGYFPVSPPIHDKESGWDLWRVRPAVARRFGYSVFLSEADAYEHWQGEHQTLSDRNGLAPDGTPRKVWNGTILDILEGRFVEPMHEVKGPAWSTYNGIFTDIWGAYSPTQSEWRQP